ncbi:MAG: hypothetical protein RI101_11985 [Nitrospira sp.]|jgi:predicted DNA binding CopG/RHH family protein|nr:hypothetical protein [Nitrospira sp.]
MIRKRFGSSARGTRASGKAEPTSASRPDFSDIPESTEEEFRRSRQVGRPSGKMAQQLIALRLSPWLVNQLRKMAARQRKPYQTLIHEILERSVSRVS